MIWIAAVSAQPPPDRETDGINPLLTTGLAVSLLLAAACPVQAAAFSVCHGYGCYYRTKVTLSAKDERRIENLLRHGARSPAAERAALRKAVALFEERSTATIGVRDEAKMKFGRARIKGQMDCVDESTNTDGFLRYLQSRGLMKHHTVARRTSRGSFIDGRYPHWTAVIAERQGQRWAVDSWYEPGGGLPDIFRLEDWRRRGYHGSR